jgi:RNA polymerase sigma-70 factor (ECF subfamily)
MLVDSDFEELVGRFHKPLYQFAYSLTRTHADAEELTQQTFYVWAAKGHQLRDATKVKTWLFSTLYRAFLNTRRRQKRFPHFELGQVEHELPPVSAPAVNQLDCAEVLRALGQVDDIFQAPLSLFYLEDCPYQVIADILNVPLGTVKSRIARGLTQLHRLLTAVPRAATASREHD